MNSSEFNNEIKEKTVEEEKDMVINENLTKKLKEAQEVYNSNYSNSTQNSNTSYRARRRNGICIIQDQDDSLNREQENLANLSITSSDNE